MRTTLWIAFSFLLLTACQGEKERPGVYVPPGNDEGGSSGYFERPAGDGDRNEEGEECEPPPDVDTSTACGKDTVRLFKRKPSIYFVLDTSSSMASGVLRGDSSKIDAAKTALSTVASEIGHLVKFGLTTFPGSEEPDLSDLAPNDPLPLLGCAAGEEVFPLQAGDPIQCVNLAPNGPVLRDFKRQLDDLEPSGGTSLSPTLVELTPSVIGLEGLTSIILLTDGVPNCNRNAECDPDQCILNLAGNALDGTVCSETFNCCDPDNSADILEDPGAYCIDSDASVAALERLSRAGIFTYVIGVLGEEDFDDAMNALAEAGGQPRSGDRAYYDVENLDELTEAVRTIGSKVALDCKIELVDRPEYANELNVYFDGKVVPKDRDEGWSLKDETVTLHGESCEQLQSGNVTEVQLISGCETVIR